MYGSIRPTSRLPGATEARQRRVRPAWQQHDRPPAPGQQLDRGAVELDQPAGGREVGRHHGQRPLLPVLALPQRRDGRLGRGVDREVVAAEPLDREDPAAGQQVRGRRHRVAGQRPARSVHERQCRPAGRAAHRLGVEPPVGRVGVLAGAVGAHPEAGHRRQWTVVRDAGDHGEPRPAVGAVDERVAVAPVGRVPQLGQAVRAGGRVGRDRRQPRPVRRARHDDEAGPADGRKRHAGHVLHHGQHRGPVPQPGDERRHRRHRPLRLGEHSGRVVADKTGDAELGRQRVRERPVADALHRPPDPDAHPGQRQDWVSSQSTWYVVVWASWIRCTDADGTTKRWSMAPAAAASAIRPPS